MQKQYRQFCAPSKIKDVDTVGGVVVAYWSTFGVLDAHKDRIMPGAFAKSIAERGPNSQRPRIKFLWQHDVWEPVGKPSKLEEDSVGLLGETKISATSRGKDLIELYADGVITEHSIGFDPIAVTRNEDDTYSIHEVRLWEGSAVTWGANEVTPMVEMKDYEGAADALTRSIERIENALRKSKLNDDEFCESLSLHCKQMRLQAEQLRTLAKARDVTTSANEGHGDDHAADSSAAEVLRAIKLDNLINQIKGERHGRY